jgi:hypothetical protein
MKQTNHFPKKEFSIQGMMFATILDFGLPQKARTEDIQVIFVMLN